jgi:hypothetical protein
MASFGLGILLLAQYVLGITYNLYGTVPTSTKKLEFFSSPLLGAHVVVGTLLVVGSIDLVVICIRAKNPVVIIASTAGLLSIMAAWANGSAFIGTGRVRRT